MKKIILSAFLVSAISCIAQNVMTPETLVELNKVNARGISKDGKSVVYTVKKYSISNNRSSTQNYSVPVIGGTPKEVDKVEDYLWNNRVSPDGKYSISSKEVKVKKIYGKDVYPDLKESNVMIYDNLNYRHWDEWEDGKYNHVFLNKLENGKEASSTDIMENQVFDCPTKPFGGDEDFIWAPDSKHIIYVTKEKFGKDYALSTDTDILLFDIETKTVKNLSQGMPGYDMNPAYSKSGMLAWLSMARDGYESDKNDIIIFDGTTKTNLTKDWDGTVKSFLWGSDNVTIYFIAAVDGTMQLFSVKVPAKNQKGAPVVKQITKGNFDVAEIIGQAGANLIIERTDMNHAVEIYSVSAAAGTMKQLTHENDDVYKSIVLSKTEKKYVTTTDGKKMLVWVIYPPNFDPKKKYPTLLYCQGGPQSALTQFYSFRWNFQLMAANGYIIVAPNRRGMPGHGVAWNEQISKDYGGQNMKDYLTAIDEISKQPYVDKNRLGCVGASYGGYSAYYLAGNHEKRFKTFIAHDGIFDWRTMYGTTEELFFVNWDLGGAYWDKNNISANKAYNEFNPVNYVQNWDTPILIIQGEKDFRVPIEQGLSAFQAAQLKGIKSKLLLFPDENHWVTKGQNSLVWQREFFKWLEETLK